MRSRTHLVEVIALIVVILIPIAFVLYALFGNQSPTQPAAAAQQPVQTNTAPHYLSSASISLANAPSLPTSAPSDQFIPFSFTVTNTGSTSGQIPFKVSVKWSTGEQDVIDENVVTLDAGASQTIEENLKFEVATETAQVSLQLPTLDQSVQFTLPKAQ